MSSLDTNKYYLFGFASDQSPRKIGKSYVSYFLGKKVPIFTGAERFAKDYNLKVVLQTLIELKEDIIKLNLKLLMIKKTLIIV